MSESGDRADHAIDYRAIIPLGLAGLAIFIVTRVVGLDDFPLTNDEAIHLRWARIMANDWRWLYVSSYLDGKKPLFFWLVALALKFIENPLLAARLVSVAAGLGTVIGTGCLAARFAGRTAGAAGCFLALLSPFLVFHDRLALQESLAACLIVWLLVCSIALAKKPSGKKALALGACTGLALMGKEFVFVALVLPPLLIHAEWRRQKRNDPNKHLKWAVCALPLALYYLAAGIVFLLLMAYPWLRYRAPLFFGGQHLIGENEIKWTLELGAQLFRNLPAIREVLWLYFGPTTILLILAWLLFPKHRKQTLANPIAGLAFMLLILQTLVLNVFHPRYFLYLTPLFLAVAATGLTRLVAWLSTRLRLRPALLFAVAAVFFVPSFWNSVRIAVSPLAADLPQIDRFNYFSGWPSGYGVAETAAKLRELARREPLDVFLPPIWGNPTSALILALENEPRLRLHPAPWYLDRPILGFAMEGKSVVGPADEFGLANETIDPTTLGRCVFVANVPAVSLAKLNRLNPGLEPIEAFFRPGKQSFIALLELPKP